MSNLKEKKKPLWKMKIKKLIFHNHKQLLEEKLT